jgi:formamidopyrimidine-DNA glycosylase
MPELPDITAYIDALKPRTLNKRIVRIRVAGPFFLRSFDPPISAAEGNTVRALRRMGKRIVFGLEDELFLVLHLMIAGRLHWKTAATKLKGKIDLGAIEFENGTLLITEASTKKRASLHLVRGESALQELNPGGIEVLECDLAAFSAAVQRENHTIKRALTDPHLFSGIGNAYSDEILHRARLSPVKLTTRLSAAEIKQLFAATRATLKEWSERLRVQAAGEFPEGVTAFRPEMAVHGRYGKPCPVCGTPVQRIVYAENEANYCAQCQTGGKLLADRSLSRLLKKDWPKTLEELDEMKAALRPKS